MGNLSPAAIATELVDVLLPRVPMPKRSFQGDVAPLVGTYSGPSRGRAMSVKVTATENGPAVSVNNGGAMPLSWVNGRTFTNGGQTVTFERSGTTGTATVVRIDSGGGHFVLCRQPD